MNRAIDASPIRQSTIDLMRFIPLNKRLAFKIINRTARQIRGIRLTRTYFGKQMWCALSDMIPSYIFHFGVWEPNISRAIQEILSPGDIFCDVGANVGYDTLLGASVVGPTGMVVAVEPSPTNLERLARNIELNGESNIKVIPAAIAEKKGVLPLYFGPRGNSGMHSLLPSEAGARKVEVSCLTMNDVLDTTEKLRTKLVKIDVEGAEAPVLNQILDDIDSYHPNLHVLVEFTPEQGSDIRDICEKFTRLGFNMFAIDNEYDLLAGYVHFKGISAPRRIDEMPTHKQDLLFARP